MFVVNSHRIVAEVPIESADGLFLLPVQVPEGENGRLVARSLTRILLALCEVAPFNGVLDAALDAVRVWTVGRSFLSTGLKEDVSDVNSLEGIVTCLLVHWGGGNDGGEGQDGRDNEGTHVELKRRA